MVVAGAKGGTKADKISAIHKIRSTDLADLYKLAPSAIGHVTGAYGYAIFDHFVKHGWSVEGQADAAAVALAIEVSPSIHLYQITKNGLAAQATIQGTKFWKDDELN